MILWSHRFSQNTNKKLSDFRHHYTGQNSWQFFVHILRETITSEIVWPLMTNRLQSSIFPFSLFFPTLIILCTCKQVITGFDPEWSWLMSFFSPRTFPASAFIKPGSIIHQKETKLMKMCIFLNPLYLYHPVFLSILMENSALCTYT